MTTSTNDVTKALGLIGGFVLLVAICGVLIGSFEDSTIGDCTPENSNVVNTTVSNNVSNFVQGFVLASAITGSDARGNVTITSDNKTNGLCRVWVGNTGAWTALGYLDNTSATETFQFTYSQIGTAMHLNYSNCVSNNITKANITYWKLGTGCPYTYSGYEATTTATTLGFGTLKIAAILAIILIAGIILLAIRQQLSD